MLSFKFIADNSFMYEEGFFYFQPIATIFTAILSWIHKRVYLLCLQFSWIHNLSRFLYPNISSASSCLILWNFYYNLYTCTLIPLLFSYKFILYVFLIILIIIFLFTSLKVILLYFILFLLAFSIFFKTSP